MWDTHVRQLWTRHENTPFPDCRGSVIDGVDLLILDADLTGCVQHFVIGPPQGGDDLQLLILREVTEALTRVIPLLVPGPTAHYFTLNQQLAAATLRYLQQRPPHTPPPPR